MKPTRAITTAASTSWFLRSGAMLVQPVIRGHADRERQRFVGLRFAQRDVVDDDELRRTLHAIEKLTEVFIAALQHHPDDETAQMRVLGGWLDLGRPVLPLDVALVGERRKARV